MRSYILHTYPLFILLMSIHSMVSAQECGTVLTDPTLIDPVALQSYVQSRNHERSLTKIPVGITIHVVEQVAGASNIALERLYSELDAVNQIYNASGFEFFFCGSPRTIGGGKAIYTYDEAARLLNQPYHVPNTINIFYLDEIGSRELSSFACGISTFPFNSRPETRFIIMQKDCSTNGSTLAHEIGHFFGLLHTHETAVGVELVNGSNCNDAGDLICDTPADPNLATSGLSGCSYTASFTDSNGDIYRPDPSNIMSYAPATCRRRFSDEQSSVMNFWYETELSYLATECDQYPDFAIASQNDPITLSSGQNLELEIAFAEEGIEQVKKVAIEILLQSEAQLIPFTIYRDSILFDGDLQEFIDELDIPIPLSSSSGTYKMTIILDPNGTILERDKRNNILILEINIDNSNFADVTLFPNPASDFIRIFFRDKNITGKTKIVVTDVLGREYLDRSLFKNKEELFAEMDLQTLKPGMYFLTIAFDNSDRYQSYLFLKE